MNITFSHANHQENTLALILDQAKKHLANQPSKKLGGALKNKIRENVEKLVSDFSFICLRSALASRVGTGEAEGFDEELDSTEYHDANDATEEPIRKEETETDSQVQTSTGFQGGYGSSSLKECIELLNTTNRNTPAPLDSGIGDSAGPPQIVPGDSWGILRRQMSVNPGLFALGYNGDTESHGKSLSS